MATSIIEFISCCCYRKGTNFQANHNGSSYHCGKRGVVVATAKVQIFKQITTYSHMNGLTACCCCYRKGTNFQANHNGKVNHIARLNVVVATAKVQIFKQITTTSSLQAVKPLLLLLPQRYKFSSKSQRICSLGSKCCRCCCYRKGTNFQANHNRACSVFRWNRLLLLPQRYKFSSKSQPHPLYKPLSRCCCYRKGTNFQANHNKTDMIPSTKKVVVATAKVQIFKQITTACAAKVAANLLLLLPQRYKFSSKSQLKLVEPPCWRSCCCYRKGTNFQANHNPLLWRYFQSSVVVATAKVQIFKQITTTSSLQAVKPLLLLLPQRYKCCCYRKGTNFQANHNRKRLLCP